MSVDRYLREPRLPRKSPVAVLNLRADNDRSGNPRRLYAVIAPSGSLIDVFDENHGEGEQAVWSRYPWFQHTVAQRLGLEVSYAISVDVPPAEYRHWLQRDTDTWSVGAERIRKMARRAARWCAVRDALVDIRRSMAEHEGRERRARQEGRENHYGDTSPAVIYHRSLEHGGDDASEHLRRAMAVLADAGMVQPVFVDEISGQYRATETTPDLY